jgi:hypothetical protein
MYDTKFGRMLKKKGGRIDERGVQWVLMCEEIRE